MRVARPPRASATRGTMGDRVCWATSATMVTAGRPGAAGSMAYFCISRRSISTPAIRVLVAMVFSCVASRNKRGRSARESYPGLPYLWIDFMRPGPAGAAQASRSGGPTPGWLRSARPKGSQKQQLIHLLNSFVFKPRAPGVGRTAQRASPATPKGRKSIASSRKVRRQR